jgi:hypothetical protein
MIVNHLVIHDGSSETSSIACETSSVASLQVGEADDQKRDVGAREKTFIRWTWTSVYLMLHQSDGK